MKSLDTVDSNSPTIFNTQPLNTSSSKICLETTPSVKKRLALHPNWDGLKKIEINKDIFKHLVISESLAEDIAALNKILFDDVETLDNSNSSATDERNNDPNQTNKTRFRAIKLHGNYKNYRSLIQKIAEQTQVDPALLHAIIQAESSYNPRARSPRGAVGLMQLMPATGRRFGAKNLTDPTANVYAGARYLRYLLETFDNNKKLAIAGYNAGEYAVKRHGNKIPPYKQTQKYVNKVMSLYEAHRDNM
ncbi:MAG: lytic transglycosylase domain-containing protein [Thioploca sp.]|nr:lytic transglycosylase domain-containing protein [Thioploca sp.]